MAHYASQHSRWVQIQDEPCFFMRILTYFFCWSQNPDLKAGKLEDLLDLVEKTTAQALPHKRDA